jgi:FkbH-like protein
MKKCLVLDLDNTLWGGIVGEDGMENLALSMSSPGNHFIAFQQAILDHYNRGVILAINSRNNEADALTVIRSHPNMILKEHHFAAHRINWQDKATNIRELAQELNIGLDSMVFLDDDKTNREMVKALVPEVTVPELPSNPALYTKFLNSLDYFTTDVITDEDKMRGNLYVTERLRKEQEKLAPNKESFLESLRLELHLFVNDESCLPRLTQLTEKTNQFNNFKEPLTDDEVRSLMRDGKHDVWYGALEDVFGDYGVIIFALVEKTESRFHIKSLLMSCRVFGRGVEEAFLAELSQKAYTLGIEEISIAYKETEKNAPIKEFIDIHWGTGEVANLQTIIKPSWITVIHENF